MIKLERLPDWRKRLDAYLDTLDGVEFAWEGTHCATFGADVVKAITGHDFAEGHRGAYRTMGEAMEYLVGLGFSDMAEYVASLLPEIHPSEAQIGDIAIVETPDFGPCVAMFGGPTHLTVMTLRGKGVLPRERASRAFRVG